MKRNLVLSVAVAFAMIATTATTQAAEVSNFDQESALITNFTKDKDQYKKDKSQYKKDKDQYKKDKSGYAKYGQEKGAYYRNQYGR